MGEDKTNIPPTLRTHPPWLDLPTPLTELILDRLILSDYIRFAAVCRQWRLIQRIHRLHRAPNPPRVPPLPLLCSSKSFIQKEDPSTIICYSLLEQRFYSMQIPNIGGKEIFAYYHGWLGLVRYSRYSPRLISFLNPISGVEIQLPQLLVDYDYQVTLSVTMSSPPDFPNSVVMLLCGADVFMWGEGDQEWTNLLESPRYTFSEGATPIFFEGKFYCTCSNGQICTIDSLPINPTIEFLDTQWSSMRFGLLVEFEGDLLLVRAVIDGDVSDVEEDYDIGDDIAISGFDVFKADLSTRTWEKMNDLGGRVLFVDRKSPVSMSSADAGGRKNCIYFPRHLFGVYKDWPLGEYSMLWKEFDLETEKVIDGPLFLSKTLHADFLEPREPESEDSDSEYPDFEESNLQWYILKLPL